MQTGRVLLLDEKLARFEELERMMSDPDVLADSTRMAAVAREHGSLANIGSIDRHEGSRCP